MKTQRSTIGFTFRILVLLLAAIACRPAWCQDNLVPNIKTMKLYNVQVEQAKYKGKDAVRVVEGQGVQGEALAVLNNIDFTDGTIEVELSGQVRPGADTTARGFVGIAFRVIEKDSLQFECFYLRPTNGRSSDQLRRNHAVQYVSAPQYPWFRLRRQNPGVYESYADMVPGEWTKVKIVVKGQRAKLFVNDASQPCLVVNDVKHKAASGKVGLWIGSGTEGHFRNLKVSDQ